MKLGKRLSKIESLVTDEYTHIWDCCCDHGFLGVRLLAENKAPQIHFVDIVPSLMETLEAKLHKFFPKPEDAENSEYDVTHSITSEALKSTWHVHCMDVAKLPISQFEGRQLIIIAGVGGDLTHKLVNEIHQANPKALLDFLLCPVHQQYLVRQGLRQLDHELKSECIIEENRRFYEIILSTNAYSSNKPQEEVHHVGSRIWQAASKDEHTSALRYLNKTIAHYERMHRG
ncbi:tRNA (adenine(22)-N(1))-methyltransferase TrmK, partial [Vibrio makurazakiensis]|uniref:tRNA (adenine(22)-N(1))-methyltransferase n=1 Tax=Vibrio makurazakiensis TaxID=2910250 RepID=UPI003D108515